MIAALLVVVCLGWAAGRTSGDLWVGVLVGVGVAAFLYYLGEDGWGGY